MPEDRLNRIEAEFLAIRLRTLAGFAERVAYEMQRIHDYEIAAKACKIMDLGTIAHTWADEIEQKHGGRRHGECVQAQGGRAFYLRGLRKNRHAASRKQAYYMRRNV